MLKGKTMIRKLGIWAAAAAAVALCVALPAAAGPVSRYVDRSGSIATGGTSQTLAPAYIDRRVIIISHATTETEPLCVNVGAAASCSAGSSFTIAPGGSLQLDTQELITVVAATTGHKYVAKEGAENVALSNGGSSSGSGGDASAANQVTGNASLSSIDGKTPALVSGRVPVDPSGVTSPVSAASLPLPSGAATAAKQPALGTAGTASTDVITVQGIASATPLNVAPAGSVAHDATGTSVNPLLGGGYASAAAPTNVSADGDAVRDWNLRNGAKVVQGSYAGTLAAAGAGAVDGGTARTTQASDSPLVTGQGGTGDTKCAGSASTCSVIAILKALLDPTTQLPSATGPQTPANSLATFNSAATGAQTSVADAATDTTCLASNVARKGATLYNDSTAAAYVLLANATSSATAFTVKMVADAYFEVPYSYTGVIKCIWASDASGSMRVTEITN